MGHQFKRVGLQGDPASAFEAKARQIASTDAFYLRPYIDVEIDPSTNILHAYVLVMNHDWYPRSPDFLPTAVIGPSPLGKGSAVVGVEHGGRYHAALRLKPEDAAELRRWGATPRETESFQGRGGQVEAQRPARHRSANRPARDRLQESDHRHHPPKTRTHDMKHALIVAAAAAL